MIALNWEIAITQSNKWKSSGNKIVFTNGCYDLIHSGHIDLLSNSKSKGDKLIVGLNSDRSVKKLKGDDRPIQNFDDRAIILDAINSVDMVVGFDDDTPDKIIKELLPNILVKGGDYSIDNVVGADTVISHGGSVEIVDLIPDKSTSSLIDQILKLK
ncbi:MAG: D-glycero-beta-D-manno-heptose 1-phosphate adenylyltransferase [Candidatus Neomarinimicrobiota bacterium]|nr:D-glycero-beta-D-manno-heptose 1-phosphate adenylyltransferase [Candidatus Neomarinimicrobiota bacterium]|tara:strand:- start:107 stop:577 length:471 start_codon:yes stop_codon:yes gene_type:complete